MSFMELRDSITELNEATERINKKLIEIEEVIKIIGPGLVIWVVDENDKTKKYGYYNFGKNGWHLAVKIVDDEPQQILQSARYYRLALYNNIDKIIDALTLTSKAMTERMNKVIDES